MSFKDCIFKALSQNKVKGEKAKEAIDLFDQIEAELKAQGLSDEAASAGASKEVMESIRMDKAIKKRQAALQIKTLQRIAVDLANFRGMDGQRDIARAALALLDSDQLAKFPSVTQRHKRILGQLHSKFERGISEYGAKGLNIVRNRAGIENVVRELFGVGTKDQAAKEIAQAWRDAADLGRTRANNAGANIAKRDDWGLPQSHNQNKIAKVSKDEWVGFIENKIDWQKTMANYPRSLTQPREILGNIYDSIKTDGYIKLKPGRAGRASLANSMENHRFLVFKDPDSWLEYDQRFGNGDVFDTMVTHLDYIARQTAMMEVLGPNPYSTAQYLKDTILRSAAEQDVSTQGAMDKLATQFASSDVQKFDELFGLISGRSQSPANPAFASTMAGLRNILTSAQLGSATLAAIPGDLGTATITAKYNGLQSSRFIEHYAKMLNPADSADKKLAIRTGLIAENMTAVAFGQQRFVGEMYGPQLSRRIADVVMRASLLSPHTQAARWAFGMEFMSSLADNVGKGFDELDPMFKGAMQRYGITSGMWDIIRQTKPYEESGVAFLRPDDVLARVDLPAGRSQEIADRFMEMIQTETDFAVPTTSARARTTLISDTKPGTIIGELARGFAQYKNFPVTFMQTHMMRAVYQSNPKSKAQYAAALAVVMTGAGAMTIQMRQISQGKDPRDMKDPRFWGSAVLQGGGLGIWGDFIFSNLNRFGGGVATTIAGPQAAFITDALNLGVGNIMQAAMGDETNVGREIVKFAERYTPGSSLWYLRLAADRFMFDQLQMMLDPKAGSAMREQVSRSRKEYGQDYWWKPGKNAPSRAPDIGELVE